VRAGDALGESSVSGEVKLESLSVVQRDRPAPFLTADRLTVAIERMDFLARDVLLGAVEIDGLGLRAARDKQGDIDVLALLRRPETAPVPRPPRSRRIRHRRRPEWERRRPHRRAGRRPAPRPVG
jgi:hypothetical protein